MLVGKRNEQCAVVTRARRPARRHEGEESPAHDHRPAAFNSFVVAIGIATLTDLALPNSIKPVLNSESGTRANGAAGSTIRLFNCAALKVFSRNEDAPAGACAVTWVDTTRSATRIAVDADVLLPCL